MVAIIPAITATEFPVPATALGLLPKYAEK